jgi:hypothetical protein
LLVAAGKSARATVSIEVAAAGQKGQERPSIKRRPQASTPSSFGNQQSLTRYQNSEATAELLEESGIVAKLLVLIILRAYAFSTCARASQLEDPQSIAQATTFLKERNRSAKPDLARTTGSTTRTSDHKSKSRTWRMETIPIIHELTLPRHLIYDTMLVLPNMDPALHANQSIFLPRVLLRHTIKVVTRTSILLAKAIAVALAMFLIPRTIHLFVQCFDNLQEMLGRRARSPWETQVLCGNGAFIAAVAIIFWHDVLISLSRIVIVEEDVDDGKTPNERSVTWGRILAKAIIPLVVLGFLVIFVWKNVWSYPPRQFVTANTADLEDDKMAGLVWRDR